MKKTSSLYLYLAFSLLSQYTYALNSPTDFPDLVLWLDANDTTTVFSDTTCTTAVAAGNDVQCWQDKSGNGNHVTQTTTATPTYLLNQQNSMPSLYFTTNAGNDDRLFTSTAGQITTNGSYTKFVVFSYDNLNSSNNLISSAGTTGTAFWGSNTPNNGRLHTWNLAGTASNPGYLSSPMQLTIGQYYIGATRYDNVAGDGSLSILNIDGNQVASDDTQQNHAAQVISIGNHNDTAGLDGRIAEALIYNRALNNMEIDCVEAYLATKWNIAITNPGSQCAVTDSITLDKNNYPEFKVFQRDGNNQYSFALSGSYVGNCTAVEASFNGSSYVMIDTAPTDGVFSGDLLNQTLGQGNLTVRCANNIAINDTASTIGIGDVYVVAGQSNAEGRGDNIQLYTTVAPTALVVPTVFSQNDVWFLGNDDTDPDGRNGSVWPIVGGYIVENTGVPVAFITAATGSTALVHPPEWTKGGIVCENNTVNCFTDMVNQVNQSGVNAVKAILWFQGESDAFATPATSRMEYSTALNQFISDAQNDLPGTPDLVAGVIGPWIPNPVESTQIRLATMDNWNSNPHILFGPQSYDIHISNDGIFDDFHFAADDELQTLGYRWWKAIQVHYYAGTQGRGPVVSSATAEPGGTQIDIDFSASSALLPATGLATTPWFVSDNGASISITNATVIDANTVRLTLASALTSQNVSVSYARDNSGENQVVLTDSTTGNTALGPSELPADPFSNFPVTLFTAGPDLSISIDDNVQNINTKQSLTYHLTIENNGTTVINDAIIDTQLATQLTDIQWSCTGTNGATCPTINGTGDLSIRANFPVASSLVYTISTTVIATASGKVTSMATVFMPFGVSDANSDDNFTQDIDVILNTLFIDDFEERIASSNSAINQLKIHEDAEDGNTNNWTFYATTAGSAVSNVIDDGGHAIELSGNDGLNNGFSFSNLSIESGFVASWRLKYSNAFRFFVIIRTINSPNDNIYLEYSPDDISTGLNGAFIHHGLGANANDGRWHTFTRDLEADLQATLPNDRLLRIVGFSIRGSGRIDNIMTFQRQAQQTFTYYGHEYEIVKDAMNWQNARTFATNKGGYLANIENIDENSEIYSRLFHFITPNEYANTVSPGGGSASYVWIGANDLAIPDTWVWDNTLEQFWSGKVLGNPVGGLYNNWGRDNNEVQHEPDNAGTQQSAGIALTHWPISSGSLGQTSQWNDLISAEPLYFIIEYD